MVLDMSCREADNTFRVPVQSCRGGFDFPLLFEEVILEILPLSLTLVATLYRLFHLLCRPHKVPTSWLLWAKISYNAYSFSHFLAGLTQTTWITLGIFQLVLVALWSLPSANRTRASIVTNIVQVIGIWFLGLGSYFEHKYSVRPSSLLSLYLSLSVLFGIAKVRTLWLRDAGHTDREIAIISSIMLAIKGFLLVLEGMEKRQTLKHKYLGYPPEATANIFNRVFFWWLNPLFKRGYSSSLVVDDLFVLDKQLYSERLYCLLKRSWQKAQERNNVSLLITTLQAFKWPLLAIVPPRGALVALNICQPLLLHRALAFSLEAQSSHSNNIGYGLIGAYMLVYVGMAVAMGRYQHLTYRVITMVRGAIVSIIYEKATCLSSQDADPAASLTLMSADIERIVQGWQTMHDIWANVVEIGLAIYLLEQQLGIACLVPVGVSIVALVGSLVVMSFVISSQAMWLKAIEKRISSTTSMLASIKEIKLLGLGQLLMKVVHKLRIDELDISKKFRSLLVWNMAFAWLTRIFAPIFTFATFVAISHRSGNDSALDTSKTFTSLSLFALLADPLLSLVMALMAFLGSVGSFGRIQDFIQKEDHVDFRRNLTKCPSLLCQKSGQVISAHPAILTDGSSSTNLSKRSTTPSPDLLTVQNGTFGWEAEKEPQLKGLSLTIPRGKFVVFLGPSGCGKSTLLKAILGEVACLEGSITLSSHSIAYCNQSPWHMNGTIKESIVAMSDIDEEWYTTVIRACALGEDLEQLPRGDQTVIGSKGISVSGGQSQRIALARAVYARRDIILLDDVLSSLDTVTENHIFHHLLGVHGILRSIGSTVILASSSVKRAPYSDLIVVLGSDGQVTEQGSFQDLNFNGGYISSFALGAPQWGEETLFTSDDNHVTCGPVKELGKFTDETPQRGGDISIYLYYTRSIGWISTIVFTVAITGFVFCISFPSLWVKWWASSNETEPGKHTGYYLGIYAMLGGIGMISLIIGCWQMFITMVPRSGEYFHRKLLGTVLGAPMLFFSKTDTGSILNRFSQDLQLVDMELPIAAINTFVTLVLCIFQMVFMGIASKYAAISFPLVILAVYFIQKVYLRTSRQLRFLDLEAKAPLYSHFTDSLNGLITLRAFGWEQEVKEKNYRLLDYSQRPFYLLFAVQRWLTLTLDLVVAGIAILLITLVVTLRGTISAGYVGVALFNVILFSQSIKLLMTFWTNLETHIGSILRIKSFTENVSSENLPSENCEVPSDWPSKGEIVFDSVSAEYRYSEPVIKDISLSIKAGEKVGICGRTGSGKSSLIMSLFRMMELSSGSISIDNIDISTIPRHEIRSRLNVVSQNSLVIEGTVRQNVDPTGLHPEREIMSALKRVGLSSKVSEQHGGLDADMNTLFLSHGQKQLFSLARAILRPGNILVLDEATSNVDDKTDEVMQRVIREKFSNHTILSVAHKLDTILDFDKVIVLDSGRIVESGNPYALLASETSYFGKLYAKLTEDQR